MKLQQALAAAKTEEEVKDAYVKAIGLKSPGKGKVDIQADNMWFEAKEAPTPVITMFAQLLFYVRAAREKGNHIPPFLSVIDREKAAIMETELALPALDDADIDWPKSASAVGKKCIAQVAAHIDGAFSTYTIAAHETEFLSAIKAALNDGRIIRTPITPDNLRQVFNKWVEMVGQEMSVPLEGDYAELFYADIMHDEVNEETAMNGLTARLGREGGKPIFYLKRGKAYERYELASLRGYRNFWRIYDRPPAKKDRDYLIERRDMLLPIDEQKFKGAFYTPIHIVDKAYDLLTETLGKGWQEDYIIWDMCCGVGNLELSHSNPRNLFMSTLDQPDIDNIRARNLFPGAEIFQYDYLNDDITDFGEIDYSLTNKVPAALRQALADAHAGKGGAKKILVLINPPYAEATNDNTALGVAVDNSGAKAKVAATKLASHVSENYGKASNELFAQFMVRIYKEIPHALLAMFSTLKYVNAPTLSKFREKWRAKYLAGFVVHSRAFDGVGGNFPIGFVIWNTKVHEPLGEIVLRVLDRGGQEIDVKTFGGNIGKELLTDWINRPRSNAQPVIPLKNAFTPATATKDLRGTRWSEAALAYMWCNGNDLQQASKTAIFSSGFNGGHGLYVTPENLWQAAVVFSVRRLIKPTWLNDRDQFLQPSVELSDAFKSDCLIWMLFNGSNLSAGADELEWNDRSWSLVNHFIPFTESEVGFSGRFESDFMARHIAGLERSGEAKAVLDEGRNLWAQYHRTDFAHKIRDELKLNRPDVGWYQIRKALDANSENEPVDFTPFKAAYAVLGDKLRPMVYELGFLPA